MRLGKPDLTEGAKKEGTAPDAIKRLVDLSACNAQVDHFDQNRKACPERSRRVFLSPDYKEEQLRIEFLNPFFVALGWDMDGVLDTIRAGDCGGIVPHLFPMYQGV